MAFENQRKKKIAFKQLNTSWKLTVTWIVSEPNLKFKRWLSFSNENELRLFALLDVLYMRLSIGKTHRSILMSYIFIHAIEICLFRSKTF